MHIFRFGSIWKDLKNALSSHGSPEIGHLWNYNLRSDSNKALIQAIENLKQHL